MIVFSAGFAVAWLPIWTTVTGARSYVGDATGRGFHETCDFELGVASAWSVRVPWDPVCPVNEFLPWVYGPHGR